MLDKQRQKLDLIDSQMQELFLQRQKTVLTIAKYKKEKGLPIFNAKREREMKKRLGSNIPREQKAYYRNFLKTVLKVSKDYQRAYMQDPEVFQLREINDMKRHIKELKKTIERPSKGIKGDTKSLIKEIDRLYSQLMILEEQCPLYEPSKEEMRIMAFNEKIKDIQSITLEGKKQGQYFLNEKGLYAVGKSDDLIMDRKTFNQKLKALNIGGWKRRYLSKDEEVQWRAIFTYADKHKTTFQGGEVFPYNFRNFYRLFK